MFWSGPRAFGQVSRPGVLATHAYDSAMYRDDECAVCGESLPPDHFYCREHAAGVDDRLHEIGDLFDRVAPDLVRLAELLSQVAGETWDYLAEQEADEAWPPPALLRLGLHADDVNVDVDAQPGRVRLDLAVPLDHLLAAVVAGLDAAGVGRLAAACRQAHGLNATH